MHDPTQAAGNRVISCSLAMQSVVMAEGTPIISWEAAFSSPYPDRMFLLQLSLTRLDSTGELSNILYRSCTDVSEFN